MTDIFMPHTLKSGETIHPQDAVRTWGFLMTRPYLHKITADHFESNEFPPKYRAISFRVTIPKSLYWNNVTPMTTIGMPANFHACASTNSEKPFPSAHATRKLAHRYAVCLQESRMRLFK